MQKNNKREPTTHSSVTLANIPCVVDLTLFITTSHFFLKLGTDQWLDF